MNGCTVKFNRNNIFEDDIIGFVKSTVGNHHKNNYIIQGEIIENYNNIYIIHFDKNCPINAIRYNHKTKMADVLRKKSSKFQKRRIEVKGFKKWKDTFETQIQICYNSDVVDIKSFGHNSNLNEEFTCSDSVILNFDFSNVVINITREHPFIVDQNGSLNVNIEKYTEENKLKLDGLCVSVGTSDKVGEINARPF